MAEITSKNGNISLNPPLQRGKKDEKGSEVWVLPEEHRQHFFSCYSRGLEEFQFEKRISTIFPNVGRIELELGAGKGDFLTNFCKNNPEIIMIAVEKKWSRCRVIARKIFRQKLKNAFLIQGLIEEILSAGFGQIQFDNIYMNYPDPWPKKRHHKRRTTRTQNFFKNLAHCLKKEGAFTFVSDSHDYVSEVVSELKQKEEFFNCFNTDWVKNIPNYHSTLFEKYALCDGVQPRYIRFKKL
ncbi:tRNA (guanine(46)-N(7))-methyltransferase TrmB [Candidatus Riflebacteria bacterium]